MGGRDHSVECEFCGSPYSGFNGPDECDCERAKAMSELGPPPDWHREDDSIWVDAGHGVHVDLSTDGGDTWHALGPDEARAMAESLNRMAAWIEAREAMPLLNRSVSGATREHGGSDA